MKKSLISIVVPVYNVEAFLKRCVNSLIAQDYENIEIILVDDGSTDGSGQICDEYGRLYGNIRVYHKENGGLSDARNYGMKNAQGEYILFVDSDDYIVQNACSCLLKDAVLHNADLVIGHARPLKYSYQLDLRENCIRENFECHKVYTGSEYLLKCLRCADFPVEVWRSLYSAEFLKRNLLSFEFGVAHEDELFTPTALLCANAVVLSDMEFYIYDNNRPGSIINSVNIKKAEDRIYIFEKLYKAYENISNRELKCRLKDSLCWKYLDTISRYNLTQNKSIKFSRMFPLKSAYTAKRRIKAVLFAVSPRLYCTIFS